MRFVSKLDPEKSLALQCISAKGRVQVEMELRTFADGSVTINIIDIVRSSQEPVRAKADCGKDVYLLLETFNPLIDTYFGSICNGSQVCSVPVVLGLRLILRPLFDELFNATAFIISLTFNKTKLFAILK